MCAQDAYAVGGVLTVTFSERCDPASTFRGTSCAASLAFGLSALDVLNGPPASLARLSWPKALDLMFFFWRVFGDVLARSS